MTNFRKLIFAQLNINSIRNKIDALKAIIDGNIDILMLSETKIDDEDVGDENHKNDDECGDDGNNKATVVGCESNFICA